VTLILAMMYALGIGKLFSKHTRDSGLIDIRLRTY
jgi:hypothetical protein